MTNTREMALTFNIFNYSKELRRIFTDLESPLKTRRKMSQSMATLSESPSLKRDSSSAKQKHGASWQVKMTSAVFADL